MAFGREDKVPQVRLTIVQYTILVIFLVLVRPLLERLLELGADVIGSTLARLSNKTKR